MQIAVKTDQIKSFELVSLDRRVLKTHWEKTEPSFNDEILFDEIIHESLAMYQYGFHAKIWNR